MRHRLEHGGQFVLLCRVDLCFGGTHINRNITIIMGNLQKFVLSRGLCLSFAPWR
jgi:hypothetical protein